VTALDSRTSRPGAGQVTALLGFLVLAGALLWWAKWAPYTDRVGELSGSRTWSGTSLLEAAGVEQGSAPSLTAGLAFTQAYALAVWQAVVAGLVLAAGVQALVPRAWLLQVLSRRRPSSSALVGGLLATPSMMCTCCAAPVASALRRSGAPTAGVVAYWLGNPLLNPAVVVFLALVAPWEWAATRVAVGVLLVVGGAALVARLAGDRVDPAAVTAIAEVTHGGPEGGPARRFATTLVRTALLVVPEYLLVVLLIGSFSGWLFPLGESAASWGALAAVAAVVLGTLLVIPTAGEIPLAQGLALAGLGGAVAGALLVTLPAVSLPSMVMVSRALTWRVVGLTAAVVAAGGLLAAGLLPALAAL
jgi:uncharacterized membrane protein YraQ (UPF0718 family)